MFNRNKKDFTDLREYDLEFYAGDAYLAKWLTHICYPDMLPRMTYLKDKPEISEGLGMIDWRNMNSKKKRGKHVF